MSWYRKPSMETDKAFEGFPEFDIKQMEREANSLFKPYIFFHKDRYGADWWCSRCMSSGRAAYIARTQTSEEQSILWAAHNKEACCPKCRKWATAKNTARTGKGKNLLEYHPIVYLREKEGDLYALAFWTRKDYNGPWDSAPEFALTYAYIFRDGAAEVISQNVCSQKWKKQTVESSLKGRVRRVWEPFVEGNCLYYRYTAYTVFGLEEIEKSRYRYCGYKEFHRSGRHTDLMKFLWLCCGYSRQVEMLMKAGLRGIISDVLDRGKKNAAVLNWEERNPVKAFGLSKTELKEYTRQGEPHRYERIGWYKAMKKAGTPMCFDEIREAEHMLGVQTELFFKLCRRYRLKPQKVLHWLEKQTGPRCHGAEFGYTQAMKLWKDYLDMAKALDYDMKETTALMPKQLELKHNELAAEQQMKLERERVEQDAAERAKAAERLAKGHEKYDFEMDGYFIRLADSRSEVIQEGKALEHCVGGYAERHMRGMVSILFLRRIATPDASLYTIEMQGNKLMQIHGYKNDAGIQPRPKESMAWMLEPWIDWLERGSPRDKEGRPKLRKKAKAG